MKKSKQSLRRHSSALTLRAWDFTGTALLTLFIWIFLLIFLSPLSYMTVTSLRSADEFRDLPFDVVMTVCDAVAENCPVWLGQGKRVHLGFPDPAKATGTDDEVMAVFRSVRDDIARRIPQLLKEHENG